MASAVTGTSNVWPVYSSDNNKTTKTNGQGTLGKDQFLKILVTQLKNQDPMQPLQDKEFIAQMAQFSSVEQIMNMAGEMKQLRQSMGMVSSLIGKSVSWIVNEPTGVVTKSGIVDAITYKDGVQYANVQGDEIPLDQLVKVSNVEGQQ